MLTALAILSFFTLWVVCGLIWNRVTQAESENRRLRSENVRLMERVGYEYHMAMGTPQPPSLLPSTPDDEQPSRPFRMRPPRPLSREEKAERSR